MTPTEQAHALAKKVANAGGCIPIAAIPMLEAVFREISDLREKLRISEDNRRFLAMQKFEDVGRAQTGEGAEGH